MKFETIIKFFDLNSSLTKGLLPSLNEIKFETVIGAFSLSSFTNIDPLLVLMSAKIPDLNQNNLFYNELISKINKKYFVIFLIIFSLVNY